MKGWLIYAAKDIARNASYIDWFIQEGRKQDVTLELVKREELSIGFTNGTAQIVRANRSGPLPDFVIVRTVDPLLQYFFETKDVLTFNNYNVSLLTNDKRRTYIELAKLGIPLLTTYFYVKTALPEKNPLAFPFVVKEAFGRSGKQVHLITNQLEWQQVKEKLQSNELIVQEANVQLGKDVRVFVIGKEIVAAVLRSNEKDFRANFSLGGSATLYPLSHEEKMMIQTIVDHFSFGLVGIDFLLRDDGTLVFNEIEDVVGSRTLSAVSEFNLLEKYVRFLKQSVQAHLNVS